MWVWGEGLGVEGVEGEGAQPIDLLVQLPRPSQGVSIPERSKVSLLRHLEIQREGHRRLSPDTDIGASAANETQRLSRHRWTQLLLIQPPRGDAGKCSHTQAATSQNRSV